MPVARVGGWGVGGVGEWRGTGVRGVQAGWARRSSHTTLGGVYATLSEIAVA